MLRQIGFLFSALLTLNLSVAETLRVCASLAEHEQSAPRATGDHGHHGMPQQAPAEEECEQPAETQCCSALSSCGPSIALEGDASGGEVVPDGRPASAVTARAPSALEPSPEPPPPKA